MEEKRGEESEMRNGREMRRGGWTMRISGEKEMQVQ